MRILVAILGAAALLASGAWTAALPPPPIANDSLAVSSVRGGAYPRALVSPLGQTEYVHAPPQRIVSVVLSDDEILLELVAPERLAGVTYLIDDPSTTPSRAPASAARVTDEDPEGLLRLRPDLVVSAGYTRAEAIVLLQAAGVPVLGTGAHANLDDVLSAIGTLGDVVDEPERARALRDSLRARIDAVEGRSRRTPVPRVLVWEGGFTYGRGTMPDDLVRRAGAVDVASEAAMTGPVALTEEAAVSLAPDVILVPIEGPTPVWREPALLGDAPIWRAVDAVTRGDVYGIPRAWLGSVSHHAVRALEAVADILDARKP